MTTLRATHIRPPIPTRQFDWACIDESTYDGAPDSGHASRIIGHGPTEADAVQDWVEQAEEYGVPLESIIERCARLIGHSPRIDEDGQGWTCAQGCGKTWPLPDAHA